jgi:hypothetical protein
MSSLHRITRRTLTSAAWGRGLADYGHIAYVTTDGGHTAIACHRPASDEIIRPARVVRALSTQKRPHAKGIRTPDPHTARTRRNV